MINIRFNDVFRRYTCRTSEDFSSNCKACPEWPHCRSTERMRGRNSVYESSRSAKCPRLGRANILPDRCQWWWGSEGRAPPGKNDSNRFIESPNGRSQRPSSAKLPLAMRKTIFPPIFESRPYVLETRRSARGSLEGNAISIFRRRDVRRVGGLKRSDSAHKSNVDPRKIVLSLFTANHHPLWVWNLAMFLYIDPSVAVYLEIRKVKRIRFHFNAIYRFLFFFFQ